MTPPGPTRNAVPALVIRILHLSDPGRSECRNCEELMAEFAPVGKRHTRQPRPVPSHRERDRVDTMPFFSKHDHIPLHGIFQVMAPVRGRPSPHRGRQPAQFESPQGNDPETANDPTEPFLVSFSVLAPPGPESEDCFRAEDRQPASASACRDARAKPGATTRQMVVFPPFIIASLLRDRSNKTKMWLYLGRALFVGNEPEAGTEGVSHVRAE